MTAHDPALAEKDELRDLIMVRRGMATAQIEARPAFSARTNRPYDPAWVLACCTEDLAVLDRHSPYRLPPDYECVWCGHRWPCPDAQSIARRYGRTLA